MKTTESVRLNCTMGENTARMIEMALRLLIQNIERTLQDPETVAQLTEREKQTMQDLVPHATFVANDLRTKLNGWADEEAALAAFINNSDRTLN